MKYKGLSNKELAQALKACSSKKGNRCSSCPIFGHEDWQCSKHIMEEAAKRLYALEENNDKVY